MHQPIRDNLEDYLKGSAQRVPREFHEHLAACDSCAGELQLLETQSSMLRSLKATGEVEPRSGFYARVIERIEAQRPQSMWSLLLEPSFGRRLAFASATLAVLLGTYLVTSESGEPDMSSISAQVVYSQAPSATDVSLEQSSFQQQRQRDAVLVNLASFHE
jgi:predicted anti-sigma-YlaC factor YlaD